MNKFELVYVWIDKYKNIKEQGFDFSNKIKYEYDKDKKELINIIENKQHYSIFPSNINIIAIVGENGTGKSSLLEYIHNETCYLCNIETLEIKNKKIDSLYLSTEKLNNKNFIDEILYFSLKNKETKFVKNDFLPNALEINLDLDINFNFLRDFDFYRIKDRDKNIFDNKNNEFILDDIIYINEEMNKAFKNIKKKLFEKVDFEDIIYFNYFYKKLQLLEKVEADNILFFETDENNFEETHTEIGEYIDFFISVIFDRNKYIENFSKEINELVKKYNKNIDRLVELYNNLNININEESKLIYILFEKNKNLETILKEKESPIKLDFLQINTNKQIIKFRNLSKGEQDLLKIYAFIFNELEQSEKKNITILLDEPIVYWHPNWQKELISKIISFYEIFSKDISINTIITTHSPFLLSDLPKENIIFLKRDENGNCKNVSDNIEIKQTFGANIHTLLSDGFFMQNGLMGEFAKSKIEEIKKFYEIVKFLEHKNKKYKRILKILYLFKIKNFNHIQSIIGEKFLQTIIKNYLDELEEIFDDGTYKNRKKEELLKQFSKEELQKYLDEMK